jgi:hypothetical protein
MARRTVPVRQKASPPKILPYSRTVPRRCAEDRQRGHGLDAHLAALVLMMTAPGLALFYGGMVRRHNVLATIMQSFIIMALISIQWVLWGYSVAFGPDLAGLIGRLDWIGLRIHKEDEVLGLDLSQHNESAYAFGFVSTTGHGGGAGHVGHH